MKLIPITYRATFEQPKVRKSLRIVQTTPFWKAALQDVRRKIPRWRGHIAKLNRGLAAMAEEDMRQTANRRKIAQLRKLIGVCTGQLLESEGRDATRRRIRQG